MNIEKLKPWNWFKHEESGSTASHVPVTREESAPMPAYSGGDPLMRMHQEMDRWFNDVIRSFGLPSGYAGWRQFEPGLANAGQVYRPRLDVCGDDHRYEIALDVPGMTEDDLSIEIRGDVLVIKGQVEQKTEDRDRHFYRVERSYGSFQRTLSLPDDADADHMEAKLDKGVLRLEIPRREVENKDVRKISIAA